MFEKILADQSEPEEGEEHLAALTAGPRDHWADVRTKYFGSGVNKVSLSTIEKVSFAL